MTIGSVMAAPMGSEAQVNPTGSQLSSLMLWPQVATLSRMPYPARIIQ